MKPEEVNQKMLGASPPSVTKELVDPVAGTGGFFQRPQTVLPPTSTTIV